MYVDAVPSEMTELTDGATSSEPEVGLRSVASLRRLLERLERIPVGNARASGHSWQEIAEALGVSKQAVHKKHAGK